MTKFIEFLTLQANTMAHSPQTNNNLWAYSTKKKRKK